MSKENLIPKFNLLVWLILLSLLLRFVTVYFIRDNHLDNEWQILVNNLANYQSYSFYTFDNQLIQSAYMPPMYAFFIYFVKTVTSFDGTNLVNLVIFIQIILSIYSIYLFYQINQNFFSDKLYLINSLIFSIIPLNIYSCGQISSINLQIFLSLLFLKYLILLIHKNKFGNIFPFSIISGLLILTRGEFLLIFILIIFFIFFNKKIKFINLIKILIIVSLVVSPYVVRNYIHFDQIFIVKSFGYNLWKGNNQLSPPEGYGDFSNAKFNPINDQLDNLEKNKFYEIKRDQIFFGEAINNLRKDSFYYFKLFFKKIFSYYFIDLNSNYPNYYNLFHVLPIFLISILSFPGLFTFFQRNKFESRCLVLYLFLNLLIFSVFFILPRYKLIILPVQIILAAHFITYIMKRYGSK